MQESRKNKPTSFNEFVGQKKLKDALNIVISSAKKRKVMPDHILLYGPPGMGKTTLANIISNTMDKKIVYAQGPTIEKKSDILSLLNNIGAETIIFIDEIHGINKNIEELIYSALDDGFIDIILGTDGEKKILRMKLPSFTLIGATTKIGQLSDPLRERFGLVAKLVPYNELDISKIIFYNANKLGLKISKEKAGFIAKYTNLNPRKSIKIVNLIFDYVVVNNLKQLNELLLIKIFNLMGIYKYGFNDQHITYLLVLNDNLRNKWAAISEISGILNEEKNNIKKMTEPLLLEKGLIEKSSRGRRITKKGILFLKNEYIKLKNAL